MTTKKKAPAAPARTPAASKASAAVKTGKPMPSQGTTLAELQLAAWGKAVGLFTQRRFAEACTGFSEAAKGPAAHIADKARSYLQICERKTAKQNIEFQTAEDHFNYGVERLNARDFEPARFHFGRALGMQPDGEHIFYTMALCCGLSGDGKGACDNLKRAIDLEPRNRILARQDPEFTSLAAQNPSLRALLSPDNTQGH